MRKLLVYLLVAVMATSALGCSTGTPAATQPPVETPVPPETPAPERTEPPAEALPATRQFTDSVGRTVELPAVIEHVAVSGPLAQIVLFALCPDKLVGIASAWDETAEQYLATEYYNLPELGQLYGGKGELNLETLLASGAQVVIDVGANGTDAIWTKRNSRGLAVINFLKALFT